MSSFLQTREEMCKWLYITLQSQYSGLIGLRKIICRKYIWNSIQTETVEHSVCYFQAFIRSFIARIQIFLWLRASNIYLPKIRSYQFSEVIRRMSLGDRQMWIRSPLQIHAPNRTTHKYTSPPFLGPWLHCIF